MLFRCLAEAQRDLPVGQPEVSQGTTQLWHWLQEDGGGGE